MILKSLIFYSILLRNILRKGALRQRVFYRHEAHTQYDYIEAYLLYWRKSALSCH